MPDPIPFHLFACPCGDLTLVQPGAEVPAGCKRCGRALRPVETDSPNLFDPETDRCHLVRKRSHALAAAGSTWIRCYDCGRPTLVPAAEFRPGGAVSCPFCGGPTNLVGPETISTHETIAIVRVSRRSRGVQP